MPAAATVLAEASPKTRALYRDLRAAVRRFGPHQEELKKTCIHLVRKSAFAGVHFRKEHLRITFKSGETVRSPRVVKAEQVSKNRWYIDVELASPSDLDEQLLEWLSSSYERS